MSENDPASTTEPTPGATPGAPPPALTAEVILNAAVAFAGHVATAAQQTADAAGESIDPALKAAVIRQYLLETATLCLRRLGESYAEAAGGTTGGELGALLREGAERATAARATVETIGDLGLDLLDRLLDAPQED